jgi:hypothetical protein
MSDIEARIREQRTIEAVKKNFMGLNGKLGCIVRNMGQPVYGSSSDGYSFSESDGVVPSHELNFGLPPEELQASIPYLEVPHDEPTGFGWRGERADDYHVNEVGSHEMGWHFDGLSSGMHLEIKYLIERRELAVSWQGYCVYKEVAGELSAYFPKDDWEANIEKLFPIAKSRDRKKQTDELVERKTANEQAKVGLLQRMRNKWGI